MYWRWFFVFNIVSVLSVNADVHVLKTTSIDWIILFTPEDILVSFHCKWSSHALVVLVSGRLPLFQGKKQFCSVLIQQILAYHVKQWPHTHTHTHTCYLYPHHLRFHPTGALYSHQPLFQNHSFILHSNLFRGIFSCSLAIVCSVCAHTHTHIRIRTRTRTHTHTHTHTHTYTHTHIHTWLMNVSYSTPSRCCLWNIPVSQNDNFIWGFFFSPNAIFFFPINIH